jgi:hypothetical protein
VVAEGGDWNGISAPEFACGFGRMQVCRLLICPRRPQRSRGRRLDVVADREPIDDFEIGEDFGLQAVVLSG